MPTMLFSFKHIAKALTEAGVEIFFILSIKYVMMTIERAYVATNED